MTEALLTTKQVAELLHVHPKQVYRLLDDGLPARRVGSEWRFLGEEVLEWCQARADRADRPGRADRPDRRTAPVPAPSAVVLASPGPRPPLLAANGDVVIEILLEELWSQRDLLVGFVQSDRAGSLDLLSRSQVIAAGCHGEGTPAQLGGERMARIHLVEREVGLAAQRGATVPSLSQLTRKRLALRAPTAGIRAQLDRALRTAGVAPREVAKRGTVLASHRAVALAVARGEADVGLLSRAWADRLGLSFRALATEPYGLIVHAADLGDPRVVRLCEVAQSQSLRQRLLEVPGYDPIRAGDIRYDE